MVAAVAGIPIGIQAGEGEVRDGRRVDVVARVGGLQIGQRSTVDDEEHQQVAAVEAEGPVGGGRVGSRGEDGLCACECRGQIARLGGAQGTDASVLVVELEDVQLVGDGRLREHEVERQIDRPLTRHLEDLDVGDGDEVATLQLDRPRALVAADRHSRERGERGICPCRMRSGDSCDESSGNDKPRGRANGLRVSRCAVCVHGVSVPSS